MSINFTINQTQIKTDRESSVLETALANGIYIPHLCSHPDLPPSSKTAAVEAVYQGKNRIQHQGPEDKYEGCRLCLVEVNGFSELKKSCEITVKEGMVIRTETERVKEERQKNLSKIMAYHPHACLTCAQHEGCSLTQCSSNVPVNERCCIKFGRCEVQKVSEYIGIRADTPRYVPTDIPILDREPLFTRNYNLCIGCTRCVRMCKEVRGIDALGFVFGEGGKIMVGSRSETLADSGCKFCGACVEVCPTGTLLDKLKITDSSAMLTTSRVKDLVPCVSACPSGMNVPGYVRAVKNGNPQEALNIIREKVPFPTVLGRVCFHPCETKCRRNELNGPIAICALKRFAAENAETLSASLIPHSAFSIQHSKKVAVVGSGPAGLTAAFYLVRLGYPVTVFESQPEPGGMMRYGIPAYRLPEESLKQDLDFIKAIGVTIKTNSTLGKDFTIDSLKKDGFQAIFVAIGAQLPKKINIEGINHKNVWWGINFLRNIREGNQVNLKNKKVIVIGGGNVAIDVALSARRLGAAKVLVTCLESEEEMPAHEWEIQQAREEGIIFNCCWGPRKIVHSDDKIKVEFNKCLCVFDEAGKFNPQFDRNASDSAEVDIVIIAVGQAPDRECLGGLDLMTAMAGIFAGGEVVHNPASVIEAIADGRQAAAAIDKYLGGQGEIDEPIILKSPAFCFGRDEGFADWKRVAMPCRPPAERIKGFDEIEKGYQSEMALGEAGRCLQCDVRLLIKPVYLPSEKHLLLNETEVAKIPENEGVFTLFNENKEIIQIKGVFNLREGLTQQLSDNQKARYFEYEEDKMYTKRESELIQQFLQKYGRMPGGGADELDELF